MPMSVDSRLRSALELIFESSPDAVAVAGGPTIVYANQAFRELYRFREEREYVGRPFLDMIARNAQETIVELARRRAMGEPVPAVHRTRSVRADGSEFVNEVRGTLFPHEGALYLVALQREVAEETPLEAHFGESFYRTVFDVNGAIKLLIEPQTGLVVDANQAAVEFYGWPLDELRRMRITDINQLSQAEVLEEMENARTGRRRYFRFRHRTATGEIRHVEVHSGPVDIEERQLLLSIVHDVTDRNALAEQLRASQQLEAVGRLAGGIAHEFNNLLTVVLNGSSMVLRKMPADSPLRRYLEDMSFASERAADLTRDLLAFSRRQVMAPQSLDLNDVVDRMTGLLQRSLGSSVSIETDLAVALPATRSDPRQLEHVLMNLVLNARDAMPGGGRITVRTRLVVVTELEATVVPKGEWVSLLVADEGEGMDEETQSRLFEPFFTTKEKTSGTGLGMATVYGIVKQSGGHIRVETAPGRGAKLEVLLPVASDAEVVSEPPRPRRAPTRVGTILLVDDLDAVRRSLTRSLESFGFRVLEAGSTAAAMQLWETHKGAIEVLVTDIVMPGTSGIELAQRLVAERPDLAVLMISGDLRGHDLSVLPKSMRKLQKPVTAQVIADELTTMLGARALR